MAAAAPAEPPRTGSTCCLETQAAVHLLKITNYSATAQMKSDNFIVSPRFAVGGHEWSIRCYPVTVNSYGTAYLSLFAYIHSDGAGSSGSGVVASDFSASVEFALLDQREDPPVPKFVRTAASSSNLTDSRIAFSDFISQKDLGLSGLILNDCIVIQCTVTVLVSVVSDRPVPIQPKALVAGVLSTPDLGQDLTALLDSKEGADITIRVGDQDFLAHRWLLAARSPVFRAELFGGMKESEAELLEIKDVDPDVFEVLLGFLYSDSLPEIDQAAVPLAQRLLVVADKYGVEKMRALCEERLSKSIDVDTAATTLALAAQHRCEKLKEFCADFITSRNRMRAVMATEGFKHLKDSCPWLLPELMEKMTNAW